MTKLKLILMAILTIFARLFALPTSAARRGFSIMRSRLPNCRWLAVCLLGTILTLSGCGGKPIGEVLKENCGSITSANTCEKAKDYMRCLADHDPGGIGFLKYQTHALNNYDIECDDKDAEKGKPFQQVCPQGAACNQGVQ